MRRVHIDGAEYTCEVGSNLDVWVRTPERKKIRLSYAALTGWTQKRLDRVCDMMEKGHPITLPALTPAVVTAALTRHLQGQGDVIPEPIPAGRTLRAVDPLAHCQEERDDARRVAARLVGLLDEEDKGHPRFVDVDDLAAYELALKWRDELAERNR